MAPSHERKAGLKGATSTICLDSAPLSPGESHLEGPGPPVHRSALSEAALIQLADEELSRRIRGGDVQAEEDLVLRFRPGLMAIARVRAGRDRADDLVQETLAAAIANLRRGDWRGDGALSAYLATILRRVVMRIRSSSSISSQEEDLSTLPDFRPGPYASAESAEITSRVREALDLIPSHHREVLLRHYLDGEGVEEIARAMGIPRGTVLSRLHHARRKMSKILNRLRLSRHWKRVERHAG